MRFCHLHNRNYEGEFCPRCPSPVSEADANLDQLVQGASTPSLSTLFKRAKDRGVIGSVSVYGEGAPTS